MSNILSPDESIQQAIDTAPSGAVICLGEGTWNEKLVIVGKSLTIHGAGAGKTVIRSPEEGRSVVWIEGDEIEVNLEGVTITGASGGWADRLERCPNGLVVKGSAQVSLTNSQVFGNSVDGLAVRDSARVTLTNSQVSGNGRSGLYVEESAHVSLQGSTVSANRGDGLRVRGSARVSLQGSTVSGNGADGLRVSDSAQVSLQGSTVSANGRGLWGSGLEVSGFAQVSLQGCTVSANRYGLVVKDSARASLEGSQVSDNKCHGLEVSDSAHMSLQGCTVSGNGCSFCFSGLWVGDSAQVSLEGSTVSRNRHNGLVVSSSARVGVRENRFLDNAGAGIWVVSEEAQVEGTPNEMRGNGADLCGYVPPFLRKPLVPQTDRTQLSVPGDYATVQEAVDAVAPGGTITIAEGTYIGGITLWKAVTLRGAGREATLLQAQEGRRLVISIPPGVQGGRLEKLAVGGSESAGLSIYGEAHLEELRVYANWDVGLEVGGSAQVNLQGCTVSGNGGDGLEVSGFAQVSLQGCTVSANGRRWGSGLEVRGSAHVSLQGCTVSGNGIGLFWGPGLEVGGSAQVNLQGCTVSGNGGDGLEVSGFAQVSIEGGLIEGNGTAEACKAGRLCNGIAVGDKAHVELTNTTIRTNTGWGIAAPLKKCGYDEDRFEGKVLWEGRGNEIYDNGKGDVCLP